MFLSVSSLTDCNDAEVTPDKNDKKQKRAKMSKGLIESLKVFKMDGRQ